VKWTVPQVCHLGGAGCLDPTDCEVMCILHNSKRLKLHYTEESIKAFKLLAKPIEHVVRKIEQKFHNVSKILLDVLDWYPLSP